MAFIACAFPQSPDGYHLWLGYDKVGKPLLLKEYKDLTNSIYFEDGSEVLKAAKKEMTTGLEKMLGITLHFTEAPHTNNTFLIAKTATLDTTLKKKLSDNLDEVGNEGFVLKSVTHKGKKLIVLAANEDIGILYGVFRLLNLMQQHKELSNVSLLEFPYGIGINYQSIWTRAIWITPGQMPPLASTPSP